MCRKVAPSPRVSATTCAARWRVMWFISISMPKVWVFMGVSFLPAAASPARPGCAFWAVSRPARTSITLPGRKVNGFFCRASLYMRVGAGKKPGFFSPGGRFFAARAGTPTRRPEPPPGTLSDFALRKSGGRHTSPLCSGKVHPGTGLSDFALVKSGRAALLRFAVKKSGGRHTSPLCSGEVGGQVGVPSRRAEVCPGGGGQIPGCAWRRPRPPHA